MNNGKINHLVTMLMALLLVGCTTIIPPITTTVSEKKIAAFSHERFQSVLQRVVDESGQVDYTGLNNDPRDLDLYYQLIAAYSPDSHPELFPTNGDKLAYWVNAYNAAAMKMVITYYPIKSVLEVRQPAIFFFLPDESGFFVFHKPVIGGRNISLYHLEKGIIRKRFDEPRIHFALNCASLGCPRLPLQAFSGDDLDAQLDVETRKFVAEERNVHIDDDGKTIFLSEIFKWYESDFLKWFRQNHSDETASLPNYISLYLPVDKANEMRNAGENYALQFIPYNWDLNDQGSARRSHQ